MRHNKTNKSESAQKSSPLEIPEYTKLNIDKKLLIKKILYLFTFYCAKASRYAYNDLLEKYFMELVCDIWTDAGKSVKEKNLVTWNDLQILYYSKGKKKNMDFGQFLDILPSLAVHFDYDMHPQESIKALMHHMISVYDKQVFKNLEMHVINFEDPISEDTREFIFKLVPDFTKMYRIYFPHEENNRFPSKSYKQESFESYLTFMKEFEVFPKLVNTRDLFYIFNEIVDSQPNSLLREGEFSKDVLQERGEVFRLSKFIETLLAVSRISLNRLKQVENVQEWEDRQKDILKVLLEYMETVKSIKKKKSHYDKERFSFIVYEEYTEEKLMKTITVHDKTIREPAEKMNFYSLLDRIDL